MPEKKKFRAVRGVRDILPPDTSLWNWFEAAARQIFESYNFREIRLPIFEETELFARSIGAETDIVSKEMYGFDLAGPHALEMLLSHYISSQEPLRQTGLLYQTLRELEAALESDRIEPTPSRRRTLAELRRIYDTLYSGLADDAALENAASDPSIQELTWRAEKLLIGLSLDRGLRQGVVLRPEATASVVRAYIEHGMQMLPGLVKLYYSGPMFRRERPQKGRYRQFYQIGAEVLGSTDHPAIDAELIEMLLALVERCKISDWTLLVNSIGDPNCRPQYVALLREELRKVKDQLGPDSQRRIETNPLRVLDSKLPEEQPIIANLPKISEHLCQPCKEHFAEFLEQLDLRSIKPKLEPRLVRGLDYYMRTTFEITSPHLGAQNALAGGGRYDGLSEMLGGPPAKGIGFALGEDRFIEAIQAAGRPPEAERPLDAFLVWMGAPAYPAVVRLGRRLRQQGFCVEIPAEEPKLRKALSLAERLQARFAVIIGENEVATGQFAVKRLADGEQRSLPEAEVAAFLKTSALAAPQAETKTRRA